MVNIFLINTSGGMPDSVYETWLSCLPPEKQEKVRKKIRIPDRITTLATHYMLRFVLEHFLHIPGEKQKYSTGKYGKPFLLNYPDVYFSLSHSSGWGVVAVSDSEVGVDIEEYRNFKLNDFKNILNENEMRYILDTNSSYGTSADRFFQIWTMKEAYLKAMGTGFLNAQNNNSLVQMVNNDYIIKNQINNFSVNNILKNASLFLSVCSSGTKQIFTSTPLEMQKVFTSQVTQ